MNIRDRARGLSDQETPGEKFRDQWIGDLPKSQWPSYIDESAQLIADGIFIGDTELTKNDFGWETGEFYQEGLASATDISLEETSLPLGRHSGMEVGRVAWTFNRLREEIRNSNRTNFQNPSRAIEAAVNKALVESINSGEIDEDELETIRLPESATVSTLVSEVFCRPRSETYIDLLLETVKTSGTAGLLDHLDEPRMVTPLWNHQSEALEEWVKNGCRGYVDMATATGKTVLGLATIAHHFGALHPQDRNLTNENRKPDTNTPATVLVIAHRDLILDQWKREFDVHLNIPEQRSTQSGEHTIEFEWGDVHFWTPKRLQSEGVPEADLVVLDETHHYLGSSGFGGILDDIEGHVLALSGSVDETNAKSLERRDIPKLYEFSLRDGQKAGVIPQCDWDVIFTPYESQADLADVTTKTKAGIDRYEDGFEVPDSVDANGAELGFETLSEARSLTQSNIGREIKEQDDEFREFASAIMARQMTQYNLSPALSSVVRVTLDNIDQHKCVVLLESKDEIKKVTGQLQEQLGDAYESLVTVFDDETDLSTIEKFDNELENGVLIGIAKTLGEGIDIETADVCINRGRGRLSRSLVQRMGRILRNPDGDKYAQFYHISGIPTRDDAILEDKDGVGLLETSSQLLSWGESFNARPVFEVDTETAMTEHELYKLESAGANAIDRWTPDHYDWPSDDDVKGNLQSLYSDIQDTEGSVLLSIERQEREVPTPDEPVKQPEPDTEAVIEFVAAGNDSIEIVDWMYKLAATEATDVDVDQFIESQVRSYVQEAVKFPDSDLIPDAKKESEVDLNPSLDAILDAYEDTGSREAAVHAAIAHSVIGEIESKIEQTDISITRTEAKSELEKLVQSS